MLKRIKIHQLWVQLQSRETMNLSRNVVEKYILVTLRKKYNKSFSVVFNEINCFSNELGLKWYKLCKKRCQFQILFFVVVFCVITLFLCTACHISSRKIMSILCFVMFLLRVEIYFHISDKLVIALWPCTILANIFLVSDILLLFHSPKGSWNKPQNSRNSENVYHIVVSAVR